MTELKTKKYRGRAVSPKYFEEYFGENEGKGAYHCEIEAYTKGTIAYNEETALINRMEKYKDAHLMFAKNFVVDFTNNLSERDLRICKNRDKMSGGFRDRSGHEMFCKILSVLRTCKRQNLDILNSIASIYKGQPVLQ